MSSAHTVIGVQYLRAIAVIFVVMEHAAKMMANPENFGRNISSVYLQGHIGVPIFFVISGFIIAMVSLDARLQPRLSFRDFAVRRFTRIVPFLWVCVAAYAAIRLVGTGKFELSPYVRAFFIWPVGELRPNVVWTLRHEMLFYLIFGASMLLGRRRPWILGAWFAMSLAVGVVGAEWGNQWILFLLNPVNVYFAAGLLLGCLYVRGALTHSIQGGASLAVVLSAGVLLLADRLPEAGLVRLAVLVVAAAALTWTCIGLRSTASPLSRLGVFLGDASYAIYLVHNIFLLVLLRFSSKLAMLGDLLIIHAMLTALAVAGGSAVHVLIERPLIRFVSTLLKQRPPKVPVAAT